MKNLNIIDSLPDLPRPFRVKSAIHFGTWPFENRAMRLKGESWLLNRAGLAAEGQWSLVKGDEDVLVLFQSGDYGVAALESLEAYLETTGQAIDEVLS